MKICRKIAGIIGAYIYGDLTPEEMKKVRLHATQCRTCADEIAAQSRAISLIPNQTPQLTDEEKLRIAWTVKGAIRAKQQVGFKISFVRIIATTLVTTALIGAAFVGGITYQKYYGPAKVKLVKQVVVKEVPAKPDKTHTEQPLVTSVPYSMMDPFQRSQQPIYRWMPGVRTAQPESNTADEPTPAMSWPWDQGNGSTAPPLILTPTPSDTNTKTEPSTSNPSGTGSQTP